MKNDEWIKTDCVFCVSAHIKSSITDHGDVISFEPLKPVTPGHLLVVPKKHVSDFTEDPDLTARVFKVASGLAAGLDGDVNLITSKGIYATQSIKHLHVHIVPRRANDKLLLPWTGLSALEAKEAEGLKLHYAHEEYEKVLIDELGELAPMAANRGWKSTRVEAGNTARKGIIDVLASLTPPQSQEERINKNEEK